ncbi:MAG TPA: hypothetical protein VK348_07490 [Planctomycetota bacterium]|nr:hypothetical protein [Planctomycetota bacterium]
MSRLLHGTLLATLLAVVLPAQDKPAPASPPQNQQQGQQEPSPTGDDLFKPFDRAAYVAHMQQLGASSAQLQAFDKAAAEVGVGRAADDLLRSLQPQYDAAVKLSEAGDPKAALELTKLLAASTDVLVQGHLRYHLARVFLDGDDPERAVETLNDYLKKNTNCTPLDDEVVFFYAQALAEVPMPQEARDVFRAFLRWFPAASERYRATANQRAQELDSQLDSDLHGLADGMKKVTRDLKKQETGKPTQEQQKKFVTKLDELIELYEQKEKQGGPPSGNQRSSSPATHSALVEGEARIGSLGKVANVADRWGDMKDKDRKQIEAEVQNGLPPQYKKMLEEYYKRLGTSGGDK